MTPAVRCASGPVPAGAGSSSRGRTPCSVSRSPPSPAARPSCCWTSWWLRCAAPSPTPACPSTWTPWPTGGRWPPPSACCSSSVSWSSATVTWPAGPRTVRRRACSMSGVTGCACCCRPACPVRRARRTCWTPRRFRAPRVGRGSPCAGGCWRAPSCRRRTSPRSRPSGGGAVARVRSSGSASTSASSWSCAPRGRWRSTRTSSSPTPRFPARGRPATPPCWCSSAWSSTSATTRGRPVRPGRRCPSGRSTRRSARSPPSTAGG